MPRVEYDEQTWELEDFHMNGLWWPSSAELSTRCDALFYESLNNVIEFQEHGELHKLLL